MDLEDLAALFAGVATIPVVWQIYLALNPEAREETPAEPTFKIMSRFVLFTTSSLAAMTLVTPVDLFYAGIASYALADGINAIVKLAYPPTFIAVPRQG